MSEKSEIVIKKRMGSRRILTLLQSKSGNKCAFPDCNNNLVTSDGRLTGEICAIKPISNNGPRGSEAADNDEYYSEENFIYLCHTHHRLIDAEPDIYTVDFLKKLKRNNESLFEVTTSASVTNVQVPQGLSLDEILKFWKENQGNSSEEFWQKFFSNHPQILSCIYPNPVVKIGEKAYFGGKGLDNKGGNIGDFIFQNKLVKSIIIVEIKTPQTKILGPLYRANAYTISTELTGAIVQTLNYKAEIQRDFHRLLYESPIKFEVLEPRCFVICGNLQEEIQDKKQLRSFELFRATLNNLDVITYDELFDKLEIIKEIIS